VRRALAGSLGTQLGLLWGVTSGVDLARTWWWMALAALHGASGVRLTTDLELVRTRGI
jgi:hypothetical protein